MSGRFQALGGRRKADKVGWEWTDGRVWDYQNWERGAPSESSERGNDCVQMQEDGTWFDSMCFERRAASKPMCTNPSNHPARRSGNHTLVTTKESLINPTFHFQRASSA